MRAGDIIIVDFGHPRGSEAGLRRPAIVVTADTLLAAGRPTTVQVVPATTNTGRNYASDVPVDVLPQPSVAQCRLITTIATEAIVDDSPGLGNTGPVVLAAIRAVLADVLDI